MAYCLRSPRGAAVPLLFKEHIQMWCGDITCAMVLGVSLMQLVPRGFEINGDTQESAEASLTRSN